MTKFESKAIVFAVTLSNAYKESEAKDEIQKLDFAEENLTEDFTAMLWGLMTFYCSITGEELDILGFINVLTRLAFQHPTEE